MTCAELLIRLLRDTYGVDTIFGIPGVHTIELYRGLDERNQTYNTGEDATTPLGLAPSPGARIRHITPRHEQGAGFMADGYARATGRPGVCFIITGPGMTNITTAMAQALADSIPMLVISSVNRRDTLGRGQGRLHELPSQQQLIAGVSRFSHTLLDPASLPEVLARAFAVFEGARPGPVHIEIPIDLFNAPVKCTINGTELGYKRLRPGRPAPDPALIKAAAELLFNARRPLLLLGGGCVDAPDAARALVETLDAPTVTTINAKGLLGRDHPLDLGANAALPAVRKLARDADVVLAVGTELGETDYDVVFDDGFILTGQLIRIDIDPEQLARNQSAALAMVADAGLALEALTTELRRKAGASGQPDRQGARITAATMERLALATDPDFAPYIPLFETLRQTLPDALLVGDSCAPVYAGNHLVSQPAPRRYFNASTGYGTLGYGLPAAMGAALAKPDLPVVALVGDGGIMFTLSELACAVEERLPVIILLWHNQGYDEIRKFMDNAGVTRLGVDIQAPDFQLLAQAFGCPAVRVISPDTLALALNSRDTGAPLLVEIDAGAWCQSVMQPTAV